MKIKPLFDKIVIEAVESMDKTQSGIVLPGTAQEKPQKRHTGRRSAFAPGDGQGLPGGRKGSSDRLRLAAARGCVGEGPRGARRGGQNCRRQNRRQRQAYYAAGDSFHPGGLHGGNLPRAGKAARSFWPLSGKFTYRRMQTRGQVPEMGPGLAFLTECPGRAPQGAGFLRRDQDGFHGKTGKTGQCVLHYFYQK